MLAARVNEGKQKDNHNEQGKDDRERALLLAVLAVAVTEKGTNRNKERKDRKL